MIYIIIYSFNVNGLNSSLKKGLKSQVFAKSPDIICLQEIKCQSNLFEIENYYSYWNFSSKKGYSGTCIYSKIKPISVNYTLLDKTFEVEGRIITLEYENFYLINVYVPNSKSSIKRVNYRMEWDELFFNYIIYLNSIKPVILCGDFNISYSSLYNHDILNNNSFVDNERYEFENLLNYGIIDAFQYLHPNQEKCYTWWNAGKDEREKKLGFRLDYFLISYELKKLLVECNIHNEINCSDHCPISLSIDLEEKGSL